MAVVPRTKPSFRLEGMPSGGVSTSSPQKTGSDGAQMRSLRAGLTEESHIHGVGMVMATPRLHYDPKPKPAVKAVDPRPRDVNSAILVHPHAHCSVFLCMAASGRQSKKSASAAMPMDLKSLGRNASSPLCFCTLQHGSDQPLCRRKTAQRRRHAWKVGGVPSNLSLFHARLLDE